MHIHILMHVHRHKHIHIFKCICMYKHIHMLICICMYVFMQVCICYSFQTIARPEFRCAQVATKKTSYAHTHSLSHTTHTRSHTRYTLAHTHSTHSLTHTTPTRSHTQHTRSLRLQLVKNTRSHSICCECVGVPGKHACMCACM
jgi:hypothetical protein